MASIRKPGADHNRCGSYPPISLTSAVGRLFESFILDRVKRVVDDRHLLRDCQFGFRAGHSTIHALSAFTDFIVDYVLGKAKNVYFGYHRLLRMESGISSDIRLLIYR